MQIFLKICSIISIIIFSLRLAIAGNLTPGTVVFIIICGLLILIGNRAIYIITAALAALILFVKLYGGSAEGEITLLQSILALALMLLGIYLMIRSIFPIISKKKYKNRRYR